MSHFIADTIRAHIATLNYGCPAEQALLAIVDKCEAMREEAGVGGYLANEFEGVIVRELNIAFPIDQVDEVKRLLGH